MANTIRLKRASGSDPGASDLVTGELAVRTDNGKLFTKKDDGSVAEVSGGGGIDDGDKGDITVSNSGATFTIDSGVVTTAKLADSNVTTAKLASDAVTQAKIADDSVGAAQLVNGGVTSVKIGSDAVTGAKIADDSIDSEHYVDGSIDTAHIANDQVTFAKMQNIGTPSFLGRNSSGTGDVENLSVSDVRTMLNVADGATNVTNTNQLTNGAGFITATLTNEQVQDIVGGMVSGNTESGITVTYQDGDGTLDFSVASQTDQNFTTTLKNKLDGIAAGATNVTNTNQLTNGAGFITATLTNEQVQDIVGGMVSGNTESGITVTYQDGDGTLDFSVASQTDNNFTNADHSKLDGIEAGATADQSASEILTLLKTVDGSGSGLDADTLDGIQGSNFVRSDTGDTMSGQYTISTAANEKLTLSGSASPFIRFEEGTTDRAYIQWDSGSDEFILVNQQTNDYLRIGSGGNGLKYTYDGSNATVWHSGNLTNNNQLTNGAGYITASSAGIPASGGTFTGDIAVSGGANALKVNANSDIRFVNGNWTGNPGSTGKIQMHSNRLYIVGGTDGIMLREDGNDRIHMDGSGNFVPQGNNLYSLGNASNRWSNIFTNDLHLSNKGGANKIDNSWGDFTIQEGSEDLYLINNRNGKMFKFVLQEVG